MISPTRAVAIVFGLVNYCTAEPSTDECIDGTCKVHGATSNAMLQLHASKTKLAPHVTGAWPGEWADHVLCTGAGTIGIQSDWTGDLDGSGGLQTNTACHDACSAATSCSFFLWWHTDKADKNRHWCMLYEVCETTEDTTEDTKLYKMLAEGTTTTLLVNWHRRRGGDAGYNGVASVRRRDQACTDNCGAYAGPAEVSEGGKDFQISHSGQTVCAESNTDAGGWDFDVHLVCQLWDWQLSADHQSCYSQNAGSRLFLAMGVSAQSCADFTALNPSCGPTFELDSNGGWCGCGAAISSNNLCEDDTGYSQTSAVYTVTMVSPTAAPTAARPVECGTCYWCMIRRYDNPINCVALNCVECQYRGYQWCGVQE